eukprot:5526365-Prymnesium_polylepis.1
MCPHETHSNGAAACTCSVHACFPLCRRRLRLLCARLLSLVPPPRLRLRPFAHARSARTAQRRTRPVAHTRSRLNARVVPRGHASADARAFYDFLFNAPSTDEIEAAAHAHALLGLRLKSLSPSVHGAPQLLVASPAAATAAHAAAHATAHAMPAVAGACGAPGGGLATAPDALAAEPTPTGG